MGAHRARVRLNERRPVAKRPAPLYPNGLSKMYRLSGGHAEGFGSMTALLFFGFEMIRHNDHFQQQGFEE